MATYFGTLSPSLSVCLSVCARSLSLFLSLSHPRYGLHLPSLVSKCLSPAVPDPLSEPKEPEKEEVVMEPEVQEPLAALTFRNEIEV